MSRLFDRSLLSRLFWMISAGSACIVAGLTAGVIAIAFELGWPLSDANFDIAARQGVSWGMSGALIAAVSLSVAERSRFRIVAIIAICATWLLTFLGTYWDLIINGLG